MRAERSYLLLMRVMVVLGVGVFAVADLRGDLLVVAVGAAVASWLLVDGPGGRALPRWIVNLMMVGATAWMLHGWLRASGEVVSVFSEYLVWLQVVKFFEPKRPRDQAQMISMSAMLVVGACLTSVTFGVGVMLALYAPVLIATVTRYQVYAGAWRSARARASGAPAGAASGGRLAGVGLERVRVAGMVVWMLGLVLVFMAGVFVAMPRGWGEGLLMETSGPSDGFEVGFADTVRLGDEGVISASRRVAMDVRVERREMGLMRGRRVLLRGAVLDVYDPSSGSWRRSEAHSSAEMQEQRAYVGGTAPLSVEEGWETKIEATIRGGYPEVLFTELEPLWLEFDSRRRYTIGRADGMVTLISPARSVTYTVYCAEPRILDGAGGGLPSMEPSGRFAEGRIRELAEGVIAEEVAAGELETRHRRRVVADALTRWLGREYAYTLEMSAPMPGEDPIEMFLFRTRRGHCEYFAGALAALCESVGVPARVVTGYALSEFDERSERYVVREAHAHAWVEAETYPGRWESFDPSPQEVVGEVHAGGRGLWAAVRRAIESVEFAWIDAVVSYDRGRQAEALGTGPGGALRELSDYVDRALEARGVRVEAASGRAMAERVLAGLAVFAGVFALGVVVLTALSRPLARVERWVRRRLMRVLLRVPVAGGVGAGRRGRAVGEIVDGALEDAGLGRPAWRPPLAHARWLRARDEELGSSAAGIAELLYRGRYGGASVGRGELRRLDELLERLMARLRLMRRGGGS